LSRPTRAAVSLIALLVSALAPLHNDGFAVASLPSLGTPIKVAAAAPILLRDPYLTDATGSSAMVNLATDTSSPAPIISWGPAAGNCASPPSSVTATYVTSFGTNDKQFKAQLSGLQPNTNYCYRVAQAGVDLLGAAPIFTSALGSGATDPFSFAVIGDWGAGTTDEANVLSRIAAAKPAFIVTVGDNVYNSGTQTEYGDLRGGNAFGPQYWPQVGRTIPAFPATGNHGFSGSVPYFQNWPQDATIAACAQSGCRYQRDTYCCTGTLGTTTKTYPSSWYAFDWGGTRFYILDGAWSDSTGAYLGDRQAHFNGPVAGCAICGAELTWLTNDLASHPAAHRFAFWHYPLYADSSSQGSDWFLDGPDNLEGVLASYGVNIVFNGHAHFYERNYPQIAGNPMLSYVTGGGGDPLGGVSGHSSFDAYAKAIYHYLRVTVAGASVTVTPTDENGATFDVQTYNFSPPSGTNDFSISANPSTLSVIQGQGATSTISTAVVSGAAQTVTLSASGLPAGATATFSPSAVTAGGSSTLTMTTASSTPVGDYSITVTGTGASASHATTISLAVNAPVSDDFSISASPSSVTTLQGQSVTSSITTALVSGSAQTVSLSASGLPAGATATFSPSAVTAGGSSTLTMTTASSTPVGNYSIMVTGTGSSATHSTSITLTVNSPPLGPRLVQATAAGESVSSTTLIATFPTATAAGHLLVLSASVYSGATNQITRVTDTANNAWVKIGSFYTAGHYSDGEMWYAANANPATSVTVTLATATVVAMEVQEFSGVATSNPLDVKSGASNTGTSAASGPGTPTASTDLAVGFIAGHGSIRAITITTAGYTAQPQQTSTNAGATPVSVITGYQVLTSMAPLDFAGSFPGAMYWAAGIALFKPA